MIDVAAGEKIPRKGGPGNGGYRSNQSNSSFMHDDDDFEGDDQF